MPIGAALHDFFQQLVSSPMHLVSRRFAVFSSSPFFRCFSFFAALFLIFCSAQIEDRVKRLSCFCSPRGPKEEEEGTTHASHNASLALWQMCFCHTDARTDRDRFVSFGCGDGATSAEDRCTPVHCLPSTDYGWAVNYD